MLRTDGLTRRFGEVLAVDSLTLEVGTGEIFGLLGPNGAGKTTTMRMLCCLLRPTAGTAYIDGLAIGREADATRIRGQIGLLPEVPGLYERLSAWKNLEFFARMYGVSKGTREATIESLLRFLDLWARRDEPVATFSKGMKQKIAIARALVHEPRYLFLDEPTAGLDPRAAFAVREFVDGLRREGRTIFLNTHNLDEAERLCDRVGILRTRLLAVGEPRELVHRLWSPTTVFELRDPSPAVLAAVQALPFVRHVELRGTELHADVDDPRRRNEAVWAAIQGAGGGPVYASELRRRLEDVYLRLMEEAG
jgi:ABC-2 type transport system ATP-binding protein